MQAVAIPNEVTSTQLKQAFIDYALKQGVEFAELPKHSDLKQVSLNLDKNMNYEPK